MWSFLVEAMCALFLYGYGYYKGKARALPHDEKAQSMFAWWDFTLDMCCVLVAAFIAFHVIRIFV